MELQYSTKDISRDINVDISSYKVLTQLDELKNKQMEKKRGKQRKQQQSQSFHYQTQQSDKQNHDDSLDKIQRHYSHKLKSYPKVDAYQRLKGYLQLQDQEIKRIRNNRTQPTIGMLYPQNEEDNRLSTFLVGQSPIRRNYGQNRYLTESPARAIQNQSIPDLQAYLKDRNIRRFLRQSVKRKEKLDGQIQDLENKKFKVHELGTDNKINTINELLTRQVPKFVPQKSNAIVDLQKMNLEKQHKSTDELPMSTLKEKLLSDNIKSTGAMYSSINPLQLQLYAVTDTILQYHGSKNNYNQNLMKLLQKTDHNRRQTLFHKHLLYNREYKSYSSQKNKHVIQQELNDNLNQRINYNEKLTSQFHKLITQLREGHIDLIDEDLGILQDLRYIILKGRNLNDEDFLELLRIRQFNISQSTLGQIINYLFPQSKQRIMDAFNSYGILD